jgi:hypothetical protein
VGRKPFNRSEQVLIGLLVVTLLPIVVVIVSFVFFGQGTPLLPSSRGSQIEARPLAEIPR